MKNDHEITQIYNNIDDSDAECSDLNARRVLGSLSSTNTIPMSGYITTAYKNLG